MWTSWDSERALRYPRGRRLGVALAVAGLLCAFVVQAADKPRHATRVTASDDGVTVENGSEDTTITSDVIHIVRDSGHGFHLRMDDGGNGVVRIFSDATVPAGQRVAEIGRAHV